MDHKIVEAFNNLPNDVERWKWLKENQVKYGCIVYLDNDDTFVTFLDLKGIGQFNDYIGWSDGAFALLEAFGVTGESV